MAEIKIEVGQGELGKALIKFLSVVSNGIGAVARPWLMERDARGEVAATRIRAEGERDLAKLLASSNPTGDVLDGEIVAEDAIPLVTRANRRLSYQEAKRQINVEAVIAEARENLKDTPDAEVSEPPVDDDFIARFFSEVQDVSNERMRSIWAALLANEVKRPTNSLRTLDVLRNLTPKEAESFRRVAPQISENAELVRFDRAADLQEMISLMNAGLLNHNLELRSRWEGVDKLGIRYRDHGIMFTPIPPTEKLTITIPTFLVTPAGMGLRRAIVDHDDIDFIKKVAEVYSTSAAKGTVYHIAKDGVVTPV